jgi:RNase H-like domain found in reverse transcriptase
MRDFPRIPSILNYCRRFSLSFTPLPLPGYNLCKGYKTKEFRWNQEAEASLQLLKSELLNRKVLQLPDSPCPLVLLCDVRALVYRAVLLLQESNSWHPDGFMSTKFQKADVNNRVLEHKLLSIIGTLLKLAIPALGVLAKHLAFDQPLQPGCHLLALDNL